MAESVRYQRFVLRMQSPWNKGTETVKEWSVKFSTSGAVDCPQADQEATVLDLWTPLKGLCQAHTSLIGWDHYPIGSATHDFGMSYTVGAHAAVGDAYSAAPSHPAQLEVACVVECPVGQSSKGRPVFLRKWIHDVQTLQSDGNTITGRVDEPTLLTKWNHGCGPHNLVPVSPTTGVQGGPWAIENHAFTHQLRRGPKKKKVTVQGPSLSDLETLLQLAKLAGTLA
jgi:hypothetical protein